MKKKIDPTEISAILKRALEVWDEPLPALDIDEAALWAVDVSTLPSTPPPPRPPITLGCGKSQKISVRIHSGTLLALKKRARQLGIPYQTLLNRQLRDANATEGSV